VEGGEEKTSVEVKPHCLGCTIRWGGPSVLTYFNVLHAVSTYSRIHIFHIAHRVVSLVARRRRRNLLILKLKVTVPLSKLQ
jgi:hypothetical protein